MRLSEPEFPVWDLVIWDQLHPQELGLAGFGCVVGEQVFDLGFRHAPKDTPVTRNGNPKLGDMSTWTTIRRVSHTEILAAPNAPQLIAEYAAECSVPQIGTIDPQAETYAQLEAAGLMSCFGVFKQLDHALDPPTLVGFASLLTVVSPHYGRKVATVESLFVASAHRAGGCGIALMDVIEDHATEAGCVAIVYSAPGHSDLHFLLSRSREYVLTSVVYCRSLQPSDEDLSPGTPVLT